MSVTAPVRGSIHKVLQRAGHTRIGRAVAADLATPTPPSAPVGRSAAAPVSAADVVELGHRIILGRPPSPELRAALVAELDSGATTPEQAWARLAASPEFAQRVAHQRAVVEATVPADDPSLLRVEDVRTAQSIEAHNASAEAYFAGRDDASVESMLAKPFTTAAEATELLTCFGHMVNGLQLVPGDRLLDFGVGSGWTSWMFTQLQAEVVCVDVSASALDLVRQRFDRWPISAGRAAPSFSVFDGHRLDLPDGSVDKICCFDAFHHLVNQAEVMAEFARVLRPGGLVGFDEPGLYHSRSPQAQYEMATYGVVEGDIDLHTMADMARGAGLEFVAADIMTTHPLWVSVERFTDLVAYQVVDEQAAASLALQVLTKQQFVLRKPGGEGPDSRSAHALRADLRVDRTRLEPTATGATLHLTVRIANTGTARWLPASSDREIGTVALGVRSGHHPGWEARLATSGTLALRPGDETVLEASLDLPADHLDDTLLLNLVSEHIAWFDLAGTPPVAVDLTAADGS